ncbi:MAG: aromatic amino acid transport family protein [Pseudomonadota bacterium]
MEVKSGLPVISVAILITGNIVGAGILGLPIDTGLAGFSLSTVTMLVMWGLMLATAVILADQVLLSREDNFDLPSLFGSTLGPAGRWVAIAANLLILYGLLVAYLSGGTAIIINLFHLSQPAWVVTLVFFGLVGGLTLFGLEVVRRGNTLMMVAMWAAFGVLAAIAASRIQLHRLTAVDWALVPSGIPIMVTAFHFHNIIPTACRSLAYDRAATRKALFIGSGIGLGMNLIWNVVVIGTIPVAGAGSDTILYAFEHGLPATVPLANLLHSKIFVVSGLLFAILAITTSFLANGTALMGFARDMGAGWAVTRSKTAHALISFAPPLLVTIVYPNLFLKALDVVGGVGIALLFGVLPGVLAIRQSKTPTGRRLGMLIVACFLAVLVFEICQETGLLRIDPAVELYKAGWQVAGQPAP